MIGRLLPLFEAYEKDPRVTRCLFYLVATNAVRGSAGTPTLMDPAAGVRAPDAETLKGIVETTQKLLHLPDADPAVRRAAAYTLASAARVSENFRREALKALERLVNDVDAGSGAIGGKKSKRPSVSSREDWELQHTVFGATRLSDAPAASTELAAACFLGVVSPDPVGARHATSLAAEISLRDPSSVVSELSQILSATADAYERGVLYVAGQSDTTTDGKAPEDSSLAAPNAPRSINLEDPFARLALARTCAHVLHSDQGTGDASRGGAAFWRMLVLLAVRDPVDMVRFGALLAMTGATAGSEAPLIRRGGKTNLRDENAERQRRIRAWNLLVSRATEEVRVPGVDGPSKLIDTVIRLILLALRRSENAARFCAAADVAASLAESFMSSKAGGSSYRRPTSSPDAERALNILAKELDDLVESPLRPVQRVGCIEALLYFQAGGIPTTLTPAKVAQVGSRSGTAFRSSDSVGSGKSVGSGVMAAAGDLQNALLMAVLKCTKANPTESSVFLGYISGVIAISPADGDLRKVIELWDASVAAGNDGRRAALFTAMEAMNSLSPPSARVGSGASPSEIARAARAEAGWSQFVATAAWWIGEHANVLCDEYVGRPISKSVARSVDKLHGKKDEESPAVANDASEDDGDSHDHRNGVYIYDKDLETARSRQESDAEGGVSATTLDAPSTSILSEYAQRNPTLSHIISTLQTAVFTASWKLRVASARALATIAIRSGEPYRLRCYGILSTASVTGGLDEDPLGVQGVTRPILKILDAIYATEDKIEYLFRIHGDDYEGWPPEILVSLAKKDRELRLRAEHIVCAVPTHRYSILGLRAAHILAIAASNDDESSGFASFLTGAIDESGGSAIQGLGSGLSDSNLAATKNREVEDMLSFGGQKEASFFSWETKEADRGPPSPEVRGSGASRRGSSTAAVYSDRDRLIESLLGETSTDMWRPSPSTNVVEESSGGQHNAFVDGGFRSKEPAWESGLDAEGLSRLQSQNSRIPDTGGTAPVVGKGLMLHTFIADANHPEELSIFEGDAVDILEESDDWMLVRDPSGMQGLVPTSYVKLQQLFGSSSLNGKLASPADRVGTDVVGSLSRQTSTVGSPNAALSSPGHQRMASFDLFKYDDAHTQRMHEDLASFLESSNRPSVDHDADGGGDWEGHSTFSVQAPGMPAGEPWGTASKGLRRIGSGSPRKSGASTPTRFHASWNATSPSEVGKGNPFGVGGRTTMPADGGEERREDTNNGKSPMQELTPDANSTASHRRMPSTASRSSHQRTLSAGSDVYASMPGSPSQLPGPERGVVAPFSAEMEGELSVNVGDIVKVHSESGGWARVLRVSDKLSGLVPSWAVGN